MFVAAALFAISFASCNKEENVAAPENRPGEQVLTIGVSNQNDMLRGTSRPLLSEAPGQSIDKVVVAIVKNETSQEDTLVYVHTYNNWQTESRLVTNLGREAEIVLSADQKLADGNYTAYAIGYTTKGVSGSTDFYNIETAIADWTSENAALRQTVLNLPVTATAASVATNKAEEVFAGSVDFTVGADGFKTNLNLHRQVAGTYGYFTNIPDSINGKKAVSLRLVASDLKTDLVFDNFNSAFTTTGTGAKYVVNGKTSADTKDAKFAGTAGENDAYTIYTITLADWFTNGDTNNDGVLGEGDTWAAPSALGGKYDEGSVFAGEFLHPFQAVSGKSTLQLQLIDEGNNVAKYWNVKLPASDGQLSGTIEFAEGISDNSTDETVETYSLVRNHLYAVGMRAAGDEGGNGGEDPDPNPDEDEPSDLSKGQDLIIRVVDNWEEIHRMELE